MLAGCGTFRSSTTIRTITQSVTHSSGTSRRRYATQYTLVSSNQPPVSSLSYSRQREPADDEPDEKRFFLHEPVIESRAFFATANSSPLLAPSDDP